MVIWLRRKTVPTPRAARKSTNHSVSTTCGQQWPYPRPSKKEVEDPSLSQDMLAHLQSENPDVNSGQNRGKTGAIPGKRRQQQHCLLFLAAERTELGRRTDPDGRGEAGFWRDGGGNSGNSGRRTGNAGNQLRTCGLLFFRDSEAAAAQHADNGVTMYQRHMRESRSPRYGVQYLKYLCWKRAITYN